MKAFHMLSFLLLVSFCEAGNPIQPITDGNALLRVLRLADRIDDRVEPLSELDRVSAFHALGYMRGFLGCGFAFSQVDPKAPFKLPADGIPVSQFVKIVEKYLSDYPERLHESADALIFGALTKAYPNPVFQPASE
jgi:hypothetical protein